MADVCEHGALFLFSSLILPSLLGGVEIYHSALSDATETLKGDIYSDFLLQKLSECSGKGDYT